MGTTHRIARFKLEELRVSHEITKEEWKCMAKQLAALDKHFSAECEARAVSFAEIQSDQHSRYLQCLDSDRLLLAEKAILSGDDR